jgi:hypothetical protein
MGEVQEFSSVGRASVSKTEGRGFESPNSCHFLENGNAFCKPCASVPFRADDLVMHPHNHRADRKSRDTR